MTEKQQKTMKIESLIKDVLAFGDLLVIANKGCGKTNSLMELARAFRSIPDTQVVIFETFPKWVHEFDSIPYVYIGDEDVKEWNDFLELNIDYPFITKDSTFYVMNAERIAKALVDHEDLLFLVDIEDTERISFFIYSVVYCFYRKNYLTAYKYGTDAIKKHTVFICEEAQNIFDSSIINKKVFNKLRKMYSETRNLKLHFVMVTQRLQDINTKIRGRTRLAIGNVSVDDWELKIRRLLKNSEHRDQVLNLDVGQFLYVPKDSVIEFSKFQQQGKPYEISIKQVVEAEEKKPILRQIIEKVVAIIRR